MVLRIFPENGLAESVTTTVWIGVAVLALANLRLGWTLSGLVVPGYVVPLMIVKPAAAAMIFLEAVLSYGAVALVSKVLSRCGIWGSFFGRDRFFAIVLASILVKAALDGYLVPAFVRYVQEVWGADVDLSNNLHSFGLIIVALIANQFWKPGLVRGAGPLAAVVGVTYLIVRFPLMSWTNFNIGNLELMYEHSAASILASPKAYVILIVTAYMASRMNLAYSWDFNGILIPALLALEWYAPAKVLASFVEAWVVYAVGSRVLRLPAFQETTVEGARKILLFFNISFAYKMLLGHAAAWAAPEFVVSDAYGFGYLLPSLMAMKMVDKKIPLRLTRTTLQTSLAGALVACLVGFGLHKFTEAAFATRADVPSADEEAPAFEPPGELTDIVEGIRRQLYESRLSPVRLTPLPGEIGRFASGLRALKDYLEGRGDERLLAARTALASVNYAVKTGGELVCVEERPPARGWGAYVFSRNAAGKLAVEVPAPSEEWATLEAGACLFRAFGARALGVSTSAPRRGAGTSREVLTEDGTLFEAFHAVFAERDVLCVRGYTESNARALFRGRFEAGAEKLERLTSSVWVKRSLPPGVSLSVLKAALGGFEVRWNQPRVANVLREATAWGYADLFLSRADRKKLLARLHLGADASSVAERDGRDHPALEQSLDEWLAGVRKGIAPRGSGLYARPTLEELFFFDQEIVTPLLGIALGGGSRDPADEEIDLAAARAAAKNLEYEVARLRVPGEDREFFVLRERPDVLRKKSWGTYLFRRGAHEAAAVEVPRPLYEENTLEYGLAVFEKLEAACLFVAGAHPRCNPDGSSDAVAPTNLATAFNAANQALLREAREGRFLVVQVRALGVNPGGGTADADALVAFSDGKSERGQLDPLDAKLVSFLDDEGVAWRFVDGEEGTGGYEVLGSAQAAYLQLTKAKSFASLWLSPRARIDYRRYAESAMQVRQFAALRIPMAEGRLSEILARDLVASGSVPEPALLDLLVQYCKVQDVGALYAIQSSWPDVRLERLVDRASQRPFLLLYKGGRILPVVASLSLPSRADFGRPEAVTFRVAGDLEERTLAEYVASGKPLLVWKLPGEG